MLYLQKHQNWKEPKDNQHQQHKDKNNINLDKNNIYSLPDIAYLMDNCAVAVVMPTLMKMKVYWINTLFTQ